MYLTLYVIFGAFFVVGIAGYWKITTLFTRDHDTYEPLPADAAQ